jgi:hypothetical protein
MILNTDPLLEPANGPNYHPFDPEVVYEMKVDNNFDGDEDVKIVFRFQSEIRAPGRVHRLRRCRCGISAPANSPAPVPPGTPIVPPAITALDGPGSAGLSLRQTYTVTIQKKVGSVWQTVFSSGTRKLYAVPANVGPRTMPDYPSLARRVSTISAAASRSSPALSTTPSTSTSAPLSTPSTSAPAPSPRVSRRC